MRKTCPITGRTFEVTPEEMALRQKLGIEGEPELHPVFRFMQLAAFWQHWNLFKRTCDRTGKSLISVFSDDCPYPVWHKDEWIKHADPPYADPDLTKSIFSQMQELFFRSPIAHNVGAGNENCEYTDDFWYSKNCYLSHSGYECEDLRYCYRIIRSHDNQYCAFVFDSEQSVDLINCHSCFRVIFSFNCWQCSDCAFLYDCRNCNHCMFSTNLRNKSYCFENEQLTPDAYAERVKLWQLRSTGVYARATAAFYRMLTERAWHRALFLDRCEGSVGNYLDECKGCINCYFLTDNSEDCINMFRGSGHVKDSLDGVSPFNNSELLYCTSLAQDQCYDIKFGYNLIQCKFMEYCAHCFQCQHCFGCCGLVGKKYRIFNKQYTPEEYEAKKADIIAAMKSSGEYGKFFPGSFAANPYDESLAGFYWPLDALTAERFGFRLSTRVPKRPDDALDAAMIPDRSDGVDSSITASVFWDDVAGRPFRIEQADITFAQELNVPLPHTYYMRRLQDNFRLIPFDGTLRETSCGKCDRKTETSWSQEYDGRVLCEECYLKEVY